jgi:hypothetical protein
MKLRDKCRVKWFNLIIHLHRLYKERRWNICTRWQSVHTRSNRWLFKWSQYFTTIPLICVMSFWVKFGIALYLPGHWPDTSKFSVETYIWTNFNKNTTTKIFSSRCPSLNKLPSPTGGGEMEEQWQHVTGDGVRGGVAAGAPLPRRATD